MIITTTNVVRENFNEIKICIMCGCTIDEYNSSQSQQRFEINKYAKIHNNYYSMRDNKIRRPSATAWS